MPHTRWRLDPLPAEAVPLLVACTADASDGLRMNARAGAQEGGPRGYPRGHAAPDRATPMRRIRLIAAGSLLAGDFGHVKAGAGAWWPP